MQLKERSHLGNRSAILGCTGPAAPCQPLPQERRHRPRCFPFRPRHNAQLARQLASHGYHGEAPRRPPCLPASVRGQVLCRKGINALGNKGAAGIDPLADHARNKGRPSDAIACPSCILDRAREQFRTGRAPDHIEQAQPFARVGIDIENSDFLPGPWSSCPASVARGQLCQADLAGRQEECPPCCRRSRRPAAPGPRLAATIGEQIGHAARFARIELAQLVKTQQRFRMLHRYALQAVGRGAPLAHVAVRLAPYRSGSDQRS